MAIADTIGRAGARLAAQDTMLAMLLAAGAVAAYYVTEDQVYAIIVAGAPLAMLLCYRHPLAICIVFVAFSFFRLHEAYPALEPFKIPLLLGLLMFFCLGLHLFMLQSIEPFWTPELRRLMMMFGIILLGVIFAQDRAIAWDYVIDVYWKVILMTFAIAWLARTDTDYDLVARVLVISGVLIAAVAIYNKMNGIGLVEGTRVSIARITRMTADGEIDAPAELQSTLSDPNDLSLVLLFPFAFAIALMVYRSSRFNLLLGAIGTAAIGLAIVFTQSRGGLIGMLVVFGTLGLRLIKSRTVAIALCVVAGLGLAAAMGLKGRVSGGAAELSQSGIDDSAMGRIYAWGAAINMAARRPLTGVGINNFAPSYYFFTDHWENRDKAVHSTWFQVLGETGLPGVIVFMMLVIGTFRSGIDSLGRLVAAGSPPILTATALSLVSGLAGFCAAGTFLTQAFTWPLYVLIGLTAALSQATKRHLAARAATCRAIDTPPAPSVRAARPTMRGMLAHR